MSIPVEDRERLYDIVGESMEQLDILVARLKGDGQVLSDDTLQDCFRLFHAVKGRGAWLNLANLYDFARAAEVYFNWLRSDKAMEVGECASLTREFCDGLGGALQGITATGSDDFLRPLTRRLREKVARLPGVVLEEEGSGLRHEVPETFLHEVEELLADAEQEFVLWDEVSGENERLQRLCLILRRLGENFTLYGYRDPATLAGTLETVFVRYLEGEVFQGEYPEEVFLQVIDGIRGAVNGLARGGNGTVEECKRLMASLQSIMRMPLGEILVHSGLVEEETVEHALRVQENDRAQREKPRRLGEVLVDMGEVSEEQLARALEKQGRAGGGIRKTIREIDSSGLSASPPVEAVMVDPERLARFREALERFSALVDKEALPESARKWLAELQELSSTLDRLPVSSLFPGLEQFVQKSAGQADRQVRLHLSGGDCELDRELLDVLRNLLTDLLDNAVRHGIETPEVRARLGKEKCGSLSLSFLERQGELWAGVEDDGTGLDLDGICDRARQVGLIDREEPRPDNRTLAGFLFRRGFTVDTSTDRGAGEGMYRVGKTLRTLKGRVDVFSRTGKGTRVTLRIPLQQE